MTSSLQQKSVKNLLLGALPASEFNDLAQHLTRVQLQFGELVHRAGDTIEHVYFPETGFISALAVLSDGQPLEMGLIGAEGIAGVSIVLGAKTSFSETMCETGGWAYRVPAAELRAAFMRGPALNDLLLRYVEVFHDHVAQTATCNAYHELGQRLARWLLGAQDRCGTPELSLTQDLIAVMLGVQQSTVSVAAGTLQKAGVIRYQQGKVTVVDRVGLENAACECYEAAASKYRHLFSDYAGDMALAARPLQTAPAWHA